MCGFAGFVERPFAGAIDRLEHIAEEMGHAITHRGPDDSQTWIDPSQGVSLAFRRLAIQDLSPAGRQPMLTSSERYVVMFNGEIYNAPSLKAGLISDGVRLRGHSDTEVLAELIDKHGFAVCMPMIRGMFAIACWDRRDQVLHLARDPIGKKPLYFGFAGNTFLFASQPKAFFAHPRFKPVLNRDALCIFFRFGYIPAPHSIYDGIEKLRPGEILKFKDGQIESRQKFWDAQGRARSVAAEAGARSDAEAANRLEQLIIQAVDRRLVSDVPVGAYLSGGVDSSTILAVMRARASGPVKSFCIGYEEEQYNESSHAEEIARLLKLEHYTLRVRPDDLLEAVFDMPEVFDEPFADPSQVPTYLLSRLTRNHVTVALSGDGGDELFGGYQRYRRLDNICRLVRLLPSALRPAASHVVGSVPEKIWDGIEAISARRRGQSPLALRMQKLANVLQVGRTETVYQELMTHWRHPTDLVPGAREPVDPIWTMDARSTSSDPLRLAQLIDVVTYLPEDILVKVDRASMAVGLEVRSPLLDQDILEFSWSLPTNQLVRDGVSKWLLRQVLYRYVPATLVDRPKMGFTFPICEWLRGPLRHWAEDMLNPKNIATVGYLDANLVRACWTEHCSGTRDWSYRLWCVLMFESWRRRNSAHL